MNSLFVVLSLKVLSLIGATLSAVGFLAFFFWPSLAPYRWYMIAIGTAIIIIAEFATHLLVKRTENNDEPTD